MREITYWVIRFTGIDGKQHELRNHFTTRKSAVGWAEDMPRWQAPEVIQMWDMR